MCSGLAGFVFWALLAQMLSAQIQQLGMSAHGPIMRASISPQGFAQNFHSQQLPEWCWAASICNIFAYYGHPPRQEEIVQAVYGVTGNFPAMSAAMIAAQVNRPWLDDHGVAFQTHLTAAYEGSAHETEI
jgi:hypothetical protein